MTTGSLPRLNDVGSRLVFCGVDWTDPDTPQLRLAEPRPGAPTHHVPAVGTLAYTLASPFRYCSGYFDLTSSPPAHRACPTWTQVTARGPCPACRRREGFTGAHTGHRGGAVPEQVRAWLAQPHWLYLDVFADGTIKVGTAAETRRRSRLAEQGALAAWYVARSNDGATIRHGEDWVSAHLGLPQALTTRRKLAALQTPVPMDRLTAVLTDVVRELLPALRAAAVPGVEVLDDPEPWQLPEISRVLFTATPLYLYPAAITAGTHSLAVRGLSGPLALLDTDGSGNQVTDLNPLVGRCLTTVTDAASPPPTQTSLF